MKPIVDKAEVSIDYPDKAYMGSFGRKAGFDVTGDADGVTLKLKSTAGEKREVQIHLHYYLLADVLSGMAGAMQAALAADDVHRPALAEAATALAAALKATPR
ncbi:MAG: hypothetical protein JNL66_01065 [Alphaproteobacteria bacterium]|nr:hypothetical protein [Alphaproteobacteria bacterium]